MSLRNNIDIANAFNKHFTNISCTADVSSTVVDFGKLQSFVDGQLRNVHTVNIPPIKRDFVFSSLLKAKCTGLDNVHCKLLKMAAPVITDSLVNLFNMSIQQSVFPNAFKCARVVPLYKGSGSVNDILNYRPISILPGLSTILEKHVYSTLNDYLSCNNLILENQSGFRKTHSCQTALITLTDDLINNIDDDFLNGVLLLDLSKAFDIVHHEILLKKMSIYNLSDTFITWFQSYLSDR